MSHTANVRWSKRLGLFAATAFLAGATAAQENPYREISDWAETAGSRDLGSVAWAYADADDNAWIVERCGQNSCADRDDVAPIHMYDTNGRWVKSLGAGMFVFPHGIYVDPDGNLWVTDGGGEGERGHQVFKLTPDGEVLMALGEAGVAGGGPGHFIAPTDVVVAPNGDVFVSDGHTADGNNRVVKFSSDGRFIKDFGGLDRVPLSSSCPMPWLWIPGAGCSSETGITTGFRSSIRRVSSWRNGRISDGRRGSSSRPMTRSTSPTINPTGKGIPVCSEAFVLGVRVTAPSPPSFPTPSSIPKTVTPPAPMA